MSLLCGIKLKQNNNDLHAEYLNPKGNSILLRLEAEKFHNFVKSVEVVLKNKIMKKIKNAELILNGFTIGFLVEYLSIEYNPFAIVLLFLALVTTIINFNK